MKKNLMLNSMPDRVDRKSFGEEEMKHYRGVRQEAPSRHRGSAPYPFVCAFCTRCRKPPEVVDIMDSGRTWLETVTTIPILFFSVQPGTMMPEERNFIRGLGKRVTEIEVAGAHMVTEDSPDDVGEVLQNGFERK